MYTKVKTSTEIEAMRESGKMLATVLQHLKKYVAVGMTTQAISDEAGAELKKLGGTPAFLNYQGFPEPLCVSINDAVVHGIPSKDYVLQDGDIISMDFGVIYNDMTTDAAISVIVGEAQQEDIDLLRTTEKSLNAGIGQLKDGVRVGDIASAVQRVLDQAGYGIVRELVGHGVGHHVHEDPNIPNYGRPNTGPRLQAGMTIAIEPMATIGDYQVGVDGDGWTVRTRDGSRSAHFEHTVLITKAGAEVLTTIA